MNRLNNKKRYQNMDLLLIVPSITLSIVGIFFIYSSGITSDGISISSEYLKQILWVVTGIGIMVFFSFLDYRRIKLVSLYLYLGMLALLLITLLFGEVVNGAKSWIGIGSLGIQPSEFSKMVLILFLASYLEDNYKELDRLKVFITALGIVGIPAIFILLQPDLGTTLVYIPIFFMMVYLAGADKKHVAFLLLTAVLSVTFILFYAWNKYINSNTSQLGQVFNEKTLILKISLFLILFVGLCILGRFLFKKRAFSVIAYLFSSMGLSYLFTIAAIKVLQGYQLMRLVVFMDPQIAPRGAGWNIIQSVTAVGSGGMWGKGFLQGTQSHYRFLPQQSTDFIFSIFAEEMGFIGAFVVLLLYALLLFRIFYIAYTAQDYFGALIAGGMAGMISFHVIENIGMAIGVMPVTGIPLIFLSYGGSSIWTVFAGIGILLSIHQRRYRK